MVLLDLQSLETPRGADDPRGFGGVDSTHISVVPCPGNGG
ncbi:SapB/AmfS family lanthipeptide [Streptomyces roseifaciens]